MINLNFLKGLLQVNLIVCLNCLGSFAAFAQSEKPDTVKCYGRTELQHIVTRVVRAKECDSLLTLANIEILNRDVIIYDNISEQEDLEKVSAAKDKIIEGREQEIKVCKDNEKKLENQKGLLKVGWVATTILLFTTTLYFIIN